MRKEGALGKRKAQLLAQRIKQSIKEDRKHRVKQTGEAIVLALEERGLPPNHATPPWTGR